METRIHYKKRGDNRKSKRVDTKFILFMKKKVLTVLIIVVTAISSNAQQFGVKAGLNLASITGDFSEFFEGRTSFHVGGLVEFELSEKFSIQPELIYSSQGAKYAELEKGDKDNILLDYLNIPVMGKYYVVEGLSIEVGPQLGILLSAKNKYEYSYDGEEIESGNDDIKEDINSIDFGVNFGVGYKLDSGLNFAARYNLGISNLDKSDEEYDLNLKNKNGVFQLSVGYLF